MKGGYADKNVVNPIAAIMAARMMFDYLGEKMMGSRIEKAITDVLVEGKVRTHDLGGTSSTSQVAEAISEKLRRDNGEIGRNRRILPPLSPSANSGW